MTPDSVKADYRRLIDLAGETVTIRRYTGTGDARTATDVDVKARVIGFAAHELVGTIQQGDRKLIVLAEDLCAGSIELPLRKGDKAVVRGRELNIETVDDNTRRMAGELIAVDLQVRG